jgi:O-antigen/teichoic acid export membrane protein
VAKDRRELKRDELERLRKEALVLDRDWRRVPYLIGALVLAVPVWWIWGPLAALYAFLAVPCLVGTAAYLIGVRRAENRQLMEELERELAADS